MSDSTSLTPAELATADATLAAVAPLPAANVIAAVQASQILPASRLTSRLLRRLIDSEQEKAAMQETADGLWGDLTGANLSLWEEQQDTARLRIANRAARERAARLRTEPVVVSRFDVSIEPAPEEEPVLVIGAVAEDGRPVALMLDPEARRKLAGWLMPTPGTPHSIVISETTRGRWRIRWRESGVRKSRTFRQRAAADQWMATLSRRARRGGAR